MRYLLILLAGTLLAQTPAPIPGPATTPAPAAKAPAPPVPPAAKDLSNKDAAKPADAAAPAAPGTPTAPPDPAAAQRSSMAAQRASIEKQRASIKQQRDGAVTWMLGPPRGLSAGVDANCEPIAEPELTPLITAAAQQHQVEPKVLRGVIEQESSYHPCAVSSKGAKGLMQLMPATAEQYNVDDAFDPKQNIEAGAAYLRMLLDKYKDDLKLALAAYNAGPSNVDKSGGIPEIKETQDYVDSIMKKIK